ncbi:hypothetical protein LCGC14_1054170 [marine sediment metagenome]|uniref:Uncharacterized protein n=1 Tax=marine sediment metagenome TaxID=412755 RepID=A0A0F9MMX5_9ZZZZ
MGFYLCFFEFPIPEILLYCSEFAYSNKNVRLTLTSNWDFEVYGKIHSQMKILGNIEIRQLMRPFNFIGIFKDEDELILAPLSQDLNNLVCIRSMHYEFVVFYKSCLLPILQASSTSKLDS